MDITLTLRSGQTVTTKIGFADLSEMADSLSRALGEGADTYVVILETEGGGVFLVRPTDVVSVEIRN